MARVVVALCVGGLGTSVAHAELSWLETRVVLEPPAGAATAVGQFQAVNRGKTPVRIADVQSGCGCTAATPDRDSIPPGGMAMVQATYRVGEKQGTQTVALKVTTEEPATRTYDLVLEVHIKPFAVLTPDVRVWRIGEDVTSKLIQLSLSNGFRFVSLESTTPDFTTQIVGKTADRVDVKVTPRDLWAKRSGSVVFKVAQPGRPPIDVTAMLRIQ
jgi:hypothetical protein